MDASKYVVIEAKPEQSKMLTSDFESEGWKLVETKTSSEAVLYTFKKLDALSTPLSMVLGHRGEKQSSRERPPSKFPMKVKDYGPLSESDD
jgi:hypothetical protein